MGSINSFKFSVILCFLLFKSDVTANSDHHAKSNEYNEPQEDSGHILGRIRIKKRSIPDGMFPCITDKKPCPMKPMKWSSTHCMNDTLGFFITKERFVHFGMGPYGISFQNEMCNSNSKSALARIEQEKLLEENAACTMNNTHLGNKIKIIENEKQTIELQLSQLKLAVEAKDKQIYSLGTRIARLEQGHQQCTQDSNVLQNQSTIAMSIVQKHLENLQAENKIKSELNHKCSTLVNELEKETHINQIKLSEYERELASCSANLTDSYESEESLEKIIGEEREEHTRMLDECKKEYDKVLSRWRESEHSLIRCQSSLNDSIETKKDVIHRMDNCLQSLGKTEVELNICNNELHDCRNNKNATINEGKICENKHDMCMAEATDTKALLLQCKAENSIHQNELASVKEKEKELLKINLSLNYRLEERKHISNEHLSLITALRQKLETERETHSDTKAKHKSCSIRLSKLKVELSFINEQEENTLQKLIIQRQDIHDITNRTNMLQLELTKLQEQFYAVQKNVFVCKEHLEIKSQTLLGLKKTESTCQVHLSNITTSLAVVQQQRDTCLKQHYIKVNLVDEWRSQYENTNSELVATRINLTQCMSDLVYKKVMFDSLEKEAESLHSINSDISKRLTTSINSVAEMTDNLENMHNQLSSQIGNNVKLELLLATCKGSLENEKKQSKRCQDSLSQYSFHNTELKHNLTAIIPFISDLQTENKEMRQDLLQTRGTLKQQVDMFASEATKVNELQNNLKQTEIRLEFNAAEIDVLHDKLNGCTENHTEAQATLDTWRRKIMKCEKNKQTQLEECDKKTTDCNTKLLISNENLNKGQEDLKTSNTDLTTCIRNYNRTQVSLEDSNKLVKTCRSELSTCRRQRDTQSRIMHRTDTMLYKCKSKYKKCNQGRDNAKEQVKTYQKDVERCTRENNIIDRDLAKCHRTCKVIRNECPQESDYTYVTVPSGCLMHSHERGNHTQIEELCQHSRGHLAALGTRTGALMNDLLKLEVVASGSPQQVWINNHANGTTSSFTECYSIDLMGLSTNTTVLPPLQKTDCGVELSGICLVPHVDVIGQLTAHEVHLTFQKEKTNVTSETVIYDRPIKL